MIRKTFVLFHSRSSKCVSLTKGFANGDILHEGNERYNENTAAQITDHVDKRDRGIDVLRVSKWRYLHGGHASRYVACNEIYVQTEI